MLTKEETQVFRRRLEQLQKESGLSRNDLTQTGASESVISRLLSGESKRIKKESAAKLAEAVGTSLERILLASVAIEQPTAGGTVLRSDAIKLITDLGKAVIDGILLSPTGAVSNTAEAFKELARMDPPQLGWVMYSRGMCAAIGELVRELANRDIDGAQLQAIGDALSKCVDEQLSAANVVLDTTTLREPDGVFIAGMQDELIRTLSSDAVKLSATAGQEIANRLPAIFAASLNREFRTHQDKYARLITEIESPLDEAARHRLDLEDYGRRLHRELHEPLFDERVGLLSMFTPLRCEWKEPLDSDSDSDEGEAELGSGPHMEQKAAPKKMKRVAGDLFRCLDDWLATLSDNYDIGDAIRVIEGDPGAGKSSATRVFAAFRAFRSPNVYDPHSVGELIQFRADVRTLLIPLHRFDYHDMLETATDGFCKDNHLPTGWLEQPSANTALTLVILDGLDELSKGGKIGAEAAVDLMDTVVNWLSRHSDRRVAFLFCGRPVAVSEAVRGQRDLQRHATVRLLPFHLAKNEQEQFSNPDSVAEDQRTEWWSRYREAINEASGGMPDWCDHDSLSELTAQPLFSYLLAVTYGLQGPDMADGFSRNQLYRDIFDRAFRGEGRVGQSKANARFNDRRPEFEEVLETIALAAWHQAGRGATMGEVEALLDPRLKQAMQEVGKTVKSGLLCVLVGHYIHARRLAGGEESFEFTHKTIGEYLTARGIVRRVLMIFGGWCARNEAHDQYTGLTTMEAVAEWVRLFGPTDIDHDLFLFLKEELRVANFNSFGIVASSEDVRRFLVAMIDHTQRYGFPMERFQGLTTGEKNEREYCQMRAAKTDERFPQPQFPNELTHLERFNRARSTEVALFAVHSGVIARLSTPNSGSFTCSTPIWNSPFAVARLVNRHTDGGQSAALFLECMNGLCLAHQSLYREQFHNGNFSGADLSGVTLSSAHLCLADFSRADLTNAILTGTNFTGADFTGADLRLADLSRADLSRVNLIESDLSRAILIGADFVNANVKGADLSGADLSGADLSGADLTGANLTGANLTEADLSGATLVLANLNKANLNKANVKGANFGGAELTGAQVPKQLKVARNVPQPKNENAD